MVTRRAVLLAGLGAVIAPLQACGRLSAALTSTYLGRYAFFRHPTNEDYVRMPQRPLSASPRPFSFPPVPRPAPLEQLTVPARSGGARQALPKLLADTGTLALVVLHEGRLAWEHYPNGGSRKRMNRAFSVTKSFASALIGAAMREGAIGSVDEPLGRWIPELRDPRARELTIAHLLEMRSGIRFIEGIFPWDDEPRTYYADDLRRRLLDCRVSDPVGKFFHYNDWHPQLISLILERATGKTVTQWLQDKLWNPLGMEFAGRMMVDRDDAQGLEHLESGLTATAIDLAKFGQFFLQDGIWQGQRLLPENWVRDTTSPQGTRTDAEWFAYYRNRPWGPVLVSRRVYYKRMWWGVRLDDKRYDFFAMGVLGEHIYVSPDTRTVIVRMSERFPPGMWWTSVFRKIAETAAA
jgi:CubicO group peptidase (beta-lactamase class C family)